MKVENRDVRRLEKLMELLSDYVNINHPVLVGGRKLSNKMKRDNSLEVSIKKVGGRWHPHFKIGDQGFLLAPCEDEKSARWMEGQLKKAFNIDN